MPICLSKPYLNELGTRVMVLTGNGQTYNMVVNGILMLTSEVGMA